MITHQEMLNIFRDIDAFLTPQIENSKCVLVVGARSSGKTCLIKYFSGAAFTRETNEEDFPYLVQNTDVVPEVEAKVFSREKITLQLTLLKTFDANSEEVTIVEMPSFASLSSQAEEEEEVPGMLTFNKIIYGIYTWNTVLSLAKEVHIFLLTPYEFITDDHKLVEFFSIWEKCLIQNEEYRSQIKQCLSIIFTKPEYEDDKQSLITSLDHLSQSGNEEIGLNNSFLSATESSRVFCFLSQDTEEGQGPELLNTIMQEADFYLSSQNELLSEDWATNFMWSLIKEAGDEKLKSVLKHVESMFKKMIEKDENAVSLIDKSISVLGSASILSLLKALPKQNSLKKKEPQLKTDLQKKTQSQPILTNQLMSKIQSQPLKPQQFLLGVQKLNNIIQSTIKQQLMIQQFLTEIEKQYWKIFPIDIQVRNLISHWWRQRLFVWRYPSVFFKLCQLHKDNPQLLHQTQIIDDLNKEITKKFVAVLKGKIIHGFKHYEVFSKLAEIKTVAASQTFKQLLPIYGAADGEEEQEEEQTGPSDPRIKRWYFKNEQSGDFFTIIKQKSKKVAVKPQPKKEQVNERQEIKTLLGALEREPENRKENLSKLGKKLTDFKLYQYALEVYMDLADPIKLYQFLIQFYCADPRVKDSSVEYMKSFLIPYLEQKAALTSLYTQNQVCIYFVYAAQFCYDYLSANLAENADQYVQLLAISNEIEINAKEMDEDVLKNVELPPSCFQASSNKDMQFLKYVSFSKAEVIERIHERDQKVKKNNIAFNQIKRLLEAPKIELKPK